MNNITKVKITGVRIEMTAHDWELYNIPGAEHVASILNAAIMENVAEGRVTTRRAAEAVMDEYYHYGATDSEPGRVLHNLLNMIFGEGE